jgi:hypothetical protein
LVEPPRATNGDGDWDPCAPYLRPDGGVDIEVIMDGHTKVDFIGHDYTRDGIMDSADFDNDFGHVETHMIDTDGDGWMDVATPIPPYDGPIEAYGGGSPPPGE